MMNRNMITNKNSMLFSHPLGQEAKDKSIKFLGTSMIILLIIFGSSTLMAQTVIETNKKVTNDIYLNTWAQNIEIDSIQKQTLFNIAMLTPYIGGVGVYSARAMLGIDPEDYNLPYRIGYFADTTKTDMENNITVYPNPTKDKLIIEFNNEFDNAEFVLYDLLGKVHIIKTISGRKVIINLDEISSGIYFYTLKGYNFETLTGKIIKQ